MYGDYIFLKLCAFWKRELNVYLSPSSLPRLIKQTLKWRPIWLVVTVALGVVSLFPNLLWFKSLPLPPQGQFGLKQV